MEKFRLRAAIFVFLCLAFIGSGMANPSEMVSVDGSAIANAVLIELVKAAGTSTHDVIAFNSGGSTNGIDQFCRGEVDLASAVRKMRADERANCDQNEITYSELLIGHHIVAFAAQPDAPAQCLQFDALQDALKPTASNTVTDWSFNNEESADLPLRVLLPDESELAYVIVDSLLAGDGLRLDGLEYQDVAEAVTALADTPGALALVPWTAQLASNDSVRLLEVGSQELGACALPSAANVESESYAFAITLYVYVNRASLDGKERLRELAEFMVSDASAAVIEAAGAIPPSSDITDLNAKLLADANAAAGVSSDFFIPPNLSGEIHVVGAANAHNLLKRASDSLGEQLNVVLAYAGTSAGIESLCAGKADIAALDGLAEADALELCATNGIVAVPLALGAQATVLLGNADDDYVACLTTDNINTIWSAGSAGVVESWADVSDLLPAQALTLFGLSTLDISSDILLQTAGETIPPLRRDTERDFDPMYRAAAVGNVSGAMTYMRWHEADSALENNQANIQLIAVDGGSGCVAPNRDTIRDGLYALSRRASLLVNESSLADIKVQAFLWNLYSDDSWTALQREGFVGASALELPILRLELLRRFADAESLYPIADANSEAGENAEDSDG